MKRANRFLLGLAVLYVTRVLRKRGERKRRLEALAALLVTESRYR